MWGIWRWAVSFLMLILEFSIAAFSLFPLNNSFLHLPFPWLDIAVSWCPPLRLQSPLVWGLALTGLSTIWPFESHQPCSPTPKDFSGSVPSRLSVKGKLSGKEVPTAATENAAPLNIFVNIWKLVPLLLIMLLGIQIQEQRQGHGPMKMMFFSHTYR